MTCNKLNNNNNDIVTSVGMISYTYINIYLCFPLLSLSENFILIKPKNAIVILKSLECHKFRTIFNVNDTLKTIIYYYNLEYMRYNYY